MLISWIFVILISQGKGAKLPIPSILSNADWPIGEDENRKNDLADSKTMKEVLETYIGNVMVAEILKYLSEEIDKVGNADIYKKVVQIASSINASNKEKSLMAEDSPQISTRVNYWFETSLAEGMTIDSTMKNGNTSKSSKGMQNFLFMTKIRVFVNFDFLKIILEFGQETKIVPVQWSGALILQIVTGKWHTIHYPQYPVRYRSC
jgi:hypothetical protein